MQLLNNLACFLQHDSRKGITPYANQSRIYMVLSRLITAEVDCEEELLMGAMKDRRLQPRTAVDWPAMVITPGACIGGEIKNLSPSGAFFHCFTEPERDQPLRLVFRDPLRKKLVVVTAELAWSNIANSDDISSCGIGIAFSNTLSYEQFFLDTWTSEHLQATV